jgi:hypothetical protein
LMSGVSMSVKVIATYLPSNPQTQLSQSNCPSSQRTSNRF